MAATGSIKFPKLSIGSIDDDTKCTAMYNPKEVQIDLAAAWGKHGNEGQSKAQQLEFTGQEGRTMALELFFDDSEDPAGSIVGEIADLEKLAKVRNPDSSVEEMRRPHHCAVVWGEWLGEKNVFKCVIESVSIKYTMFRANGVPVRATANVKLKEATGVSLKKEEKAKTASEGGAGAASNAGKK
jgi:predicted DNA-binding WGR domain protein